MEPHRGVLACTTMNWRAKSLDSYLAIIQLIAGSTRRDRPHRRLSPQFECLRKGIKVFDWEMASPDPGSGLCHKIAEQLAPHSREAPPGGSAPPERTSRWSNARSGPGLAGGESQFASSLVVLRDQQVQHPHPERRGALWRASRHPSWRSRPRQRGEMCHTASPDLQNVG